jgi:carbamate kinase
MNITEIKKQPRNTDAMELIDAVAQKIAETENTTNLIIFAKMDGAYVRYTTTVDNAMELIAQLELAKYDTLKRMDT